MNREIKFRAWDKEQKYFSYWSMGEDELFWLLVNNFSKPVQQYTGLKDKNGVEIFEGDILRHEAMLTKNNRLSNVMYTNGCFVLNDKVLGHRKLGYIQTEMEVVGNIYQNKDLLND